MLKVNENFVKLPASYLFVDINNKVNAFMKEHPEQEIIRAMAQARRNGIF